jgi:hypothetical protein
MDSLQILDQEWSALQAVPILAVSLVVIGGIVGWLISSGIAQGRIDALRRHYEARDERKIQIGERLAAVMRNEDMLKTQVAALQEYFQIVESQVLHEGRVPALIAATGSTASTITNIALTTEALAGSLAVLRLGVGGDNNRPHSPPVTEKPDTAPEA